MVYLFPVSCHSTEQRPKNSSLQFSATQCMIKQSMCGAPKEEVRWPSLGRSGPSLSGFNKKDVLDYIDELQKTHAEELAVLQEERDRLFQENQELAARESESAGKVSQAEEMRTG